MEVIKQVTGDSGIITQYGKVVVHKMNENTLPDNTKTFSATLKQDIKKTYPASRPGNSLSDGLFVSEELGGEGQSYNQSRYTIVKAPEGATAAQVAQKLSAFPTACIYAILSNDIEDVITDEQKRAMETGLTSLSLDDYKDRHEVQDKEGNHYLDGNGNRQYRRWLFSQEWVEDIDNREVGATAGSTAVAAEEFATVEETHEEVN